MKRLRIVLIAVILLSALGVLLALASRASSKDIEGNIRIDLNYKYPYDLSFVIEKNLYNENLKSMVKNSGAKIKSYNKIEGINIFNLHEAKGKINRCSSPIMAVSQSNYDRLTKKNFKLEKGHAIFNYGDDGENKVLTSGGFIIDFPKYDDYKKGQVTSLLKKHQLSFNDYVKLKQDKDYIYIPEKNVVYKHGYIINPLSTNKDDLSIPFMSGFSIILSDEDYKNLEENASEDSIYYDVAVNLNNNNEYKNIKKKLSYKLNEIGGQKLKHTLILKEEKIHQEYLKMTK